MAVERIPKGKFTKEFREEAVRMVVEEKLSVPEVGRRLQVPPSTINNWVKAYRAGKLGASGKGQREMTALERELYEAKRELARVKMERDIFKKATAYFAKESLPGTR